MEFLEKEYRGKWKRFGNVRLENVIVVDCVGLVVV